MNAPDEAVLETGSATAGITRGAGRLLSGLGYDWLREFRLATGPRGGGPEGGLRARGHRAGNGAADLAHQDRQVR